MPYMGPRHLRDRPPEDFKGKIGARAKLEIHSPDLESLMEDAGASRILTKFIDGLGSVSRRSALTAEDRGEE